MLLKFKYLFSLLALLAVFSCVEVSDQEFEPGENGHLVVDAIITNEDQIQEVRLSQSYDRLNDLVPAISDAVVMVSDGQISRTFVQVADEAGLYRSEVAFAAQIDKAYTLEINWQGQNYQGTNEMVSILRPISDISFKPYPSAPDSLLIIGEVAPLYDPDEQAFYEVNIDWAHLRPDTVNRAKMYFYTLSTIDVSEVFAPTQVQFVPFPRGSFVTVKKHALNDEFAAYFRALLLETAWQGGLFDESSSSLPTNISNEGLGFFGVCAVSSKTFIAF